MNRSVTIIPNENLMYIRPFSRKCNHHHEALTNFIFANDLNVAPNVLMHSYLTSYELAEQDFCVLLYDHEESLKNIMIFLPLNISEQQYEFFKSKKDEFKEYNINILSQEESKKFNLYDTTTHPEGIYEHLLNILEQKLTIPTNNKTKKRIKEEN